MQFICPIKINLNLHVISKRKDNYHNIQSLVVFVEGGDGLSFHPEGEMSLRGGAPQSKETQRLQVTGPFAGAVPTDNTNSILRAHTAFEEALGHPVAGRWQLNKTVPVGAGLGSASANAAAALRLLQNIHPLHEEKILSNREYIDIFWTNLFNNRVYLGNYYPNVQEELDNLSKSEKYFTNLP